MRGIVAYANARIGNREDVDLQVDLHSGLLRGARLIASPNHDSRPAGVEADLIVVHGISLPPGEFGGPWIDRLFTNSLPAQVHPYFAEVEALRVSSHLVVARDGAVTQYVAFNERAWHAGKSSYQGREACNDFSVGVELEGSDTLPYEPAQYGALAEVVAALCAAYPRLSPDRLVGHSDIAPGRKTDPGPAFDWPHARRLIAAAVSAYGKPLRP
jgi:AmpD protein